MVYPDAKEYAGIPPDYSLSDQCAVCWHSNVDVRGTVQGEYVAHPTVLCKKYGMMVRSNYTCKEFQ